MFYTVNDLGYHELLPELCTYKLLPIQEDQNGRWYRFSVVVRTLVQTSGCRTFFDDNLPNKVLLV